MTTPDPLSFVDLPHIQMTWAEALDTGDDDEVIALVPLLMDIPPSERAMVVQHLMDWTEDMNIFVGNFGSIKTMARACLHQVWTQTQDLDKVSAAIPVTLRTNQVHSMQEYSFIQAMSVFVSRERIDCLFNMMQDTVVSSAIKSGTHIAGLGDRIVRLMGEQGPVHLMGDFIEGWTDHQEWGIEDVATAILGNAIRRSNVEMVNRLLGAEGSAPLASTTLDGDFIDTWRHSNWGDQVEMGAHLWKLEQQGTINVRDGQTYWPKFFTNTSTILNRVIGSESSAQGKEHILECMNGIYQQHFSTADEAEYTYLMFMNFAQSDNHYLCNWLLHAASSFALDMIVDEMKPSWQRQNWHQHPRVMQHVLERQTKTVADSKTSGLARKM